MKKVNIFVDCHVFDKGFQGTRTYIQGLYLELIKEKDKNFYFAAVNVENLKSIFGNHDNVFYLKYSSDSAIFRLLLEIPYLIKKHNIEYAHFQYRVPPIKLCKYIVTTHDVLFEDYPEFFPKLNRIQSYYTYKFSAKISEIVFTVSEYSKRQIQKHLKIKDVIITPNGIESVFFEDYNKDETQRKIQDEYGISNYLIFISRWEPRKNHHLVLDAFNKLELYKSHFLVFVGDDTFKNNQYETIYQSLNYEVKQKIVILKRLSFEKMITLLRGSSVSIYPSIAEGFGIPPIESIAARIPTISSNTTAMSDFDFMNQYFFNPSDEKEFANTLQMVINQKDSNIDNKIEIIKQRYNWKLSAAIFNKTLNKQKLTDSLP
ncbi:glycosyltransferase family 1 protein [Flavobacterium sp.]|uniref:glycosyltransferase family 4 protein n=1 Tax=Flavobacterium sp. TaxID=239 RepID=UPI00263381F0|nr:glycosyltransferase family 1 protein [Flavobacterium sp.]